MVTAPGGIERQDEEFVADRVAARKDGERPAQGELNASCQFMLHGEVLLDSGLGLGRDRAAALTQPPQGSI
jgi:hypothetical protein